MHEGYVFSVFAGPGWKCTIVTYGDNYTLLV